MWILKAAIEKAGRADREAFANGLRQIHITGNVGKLYTGGRVKFDEQGWRIGAGIYMVQRRDGVPQVAFPEGEPPIQLCSQVASRYVLL